MDSKFTKILKTKVVPHLVQLEDPIIFSLLERAQFGVNEGMYKKGKKIFKGHQNLSYFDAYVLEHEKIDSEAGRYDFPEEVPFSTEITKPKTALKKDRICGIAASPDCSIDLTKEIRKAHQEIVKKVCPNNDDREYGSTSQRDLFLLQAMSERIHYGSIYVAECKYMDDPEGYSKLVEIRSCDKIKEKLTRRTVELDILARVKRKVEDFQKGIDLNIRKFISPEIIVNFYENTVFELTKKGEVEYIIQRVNAEKKV